MVTITAIHHLVDSHLYKSITHSTANNTLFGKAISTSTLAETIATISSLKDAHAHYRIYSTISTIKIVSLFLLQIASTTPSGKTADTSKSTVTTEASSRETSFLLMQLCICSKYVPLPHPLHLKIVLSAPLRNMEENNHFHP